MRYRNLSNEYLNYIILLCYGDNMTKKNLSNKISFEEPKLVRLTNLGNLTLKNYLDLEENYKDNASLKTEKLSKLWPSRECLDEFVSNFSGYHKSPVKSAILYEDGDYHQRYVDSSRQRLLQNRFASDMESFVELGLAYLSKAPEYFLLSHQRAFADQRLAELTFGRPFSGFEISKP